MKCVRCGAELRYDPGRQMLVCDHCEAEYDSASYVKERENEGKAEEYAKVIDGEAITAALYADSEGNATEELRVENDGGIMSDVTDDSMNVIEYVCPNCGGTLYSVEEAANGFCSFCGVFRHGGESVYPAFINTCGYAGYVGPDVADDVSVQQNCSAVPVLLSAQLRVRA